MEEEVRGRTETELHATLDKMASELGLILKNQKAIANGLARVPAVRHFAMSMAESNKNKKALQAYQRRADELEQFFVNYQHAVPSIQALRFMDKSGKTVVKVKEGKPISPKLLDTLSGRLFIADHADRAFFRDAITGTQSVVMSDFELGQITSDADFCPAIVRYSAAVKDEVDRLGGVLVVNMWGKRVDSTMEAALGGYAGINYIVELNEDNASRDGIYLYHPDTKKRFANQVGSKFRLSKDIGRAKWEYIKSTQDHGSIFHDDGRMLFFRRFVPNENSSTQWLLVIEASSDVVLVSVNNMRNSIWVLLGALLVLSLVISILAAVRMAEPMHELAGVIKRYADGDKGALYSEERKDEVGLAGKAFNYLAANMEKTEQKRDEAVRAACQSERLAALGQLAAGIGHEINNPLMNIMSLAALIDDSMDKKDPQTKSDIQLLQKEVKRCAQIVQGILNFARETEPSYHEFDMAGLLDETLALLHHRIESADIVLSTSIQSPLPMEGDRSLLQQVLVNVLLNAIQATPNGEQIEIMAKSINQHIEIEVLDSGTGIDSASYSKIFDPFFTTKPEGQGTGLGLSVSYGIIKDHGGTITVQNTEHAGVSVCITLPVTAQDDEEKEDNQLLEVTSVG